MDASSRIWASNSMNMTLLALGILLTPAEYRFEPKTDLTYDVKVSFDGFLSLLGGNEGKADVIMVVRVKGLAPEAGEVRATNEISACEILFNGAKLPLTLDNVIDYFPKTTVSATAQGKITKNDAPNRNLPVRLPGLDVRRFPDITYLPIEFPADGISEGKSWTFSKVFGESELTYTCTPTAIRNDRALIGVKVRQEYEVLEDEGLEVVKREDDAVARVKTVMTGDGEVIFDLKQGIAAKVRMTNDAVSTAVNLKSNKATVRKLKTDFAVSLKGYDFGATVAAAKPAPKDESWLGTAKGWFASAAETVTGWWQSGKGYATLLYLAFASSSQIVPGLGGAMGQWLEGFGIRIPGGSRVS